MTTLMNDSRMVSISQIKEFIKVSKGIEFRGAKRKEKYEWIEEVLLRFQYFTLRKKEKTVLKGYMLKMTGFSDAQLTRLVARKRKFGKILARTTKRNRFPKKYTPEDIARIIETDNAHNRLSGPATKRIFKRMYEVFKDVRFARLKDISVAHLYNLRSTRQYQSFTRFFTKTRPAPVNIGERRKPDPQGNPGYLRVDTIHQGDMEKEKGVYHVNLVDEITQWEIVGSVEKISEYYLQPLLEAALEQFPFKIKGFHSDNGSEFINKVVAELLNKLLIQQTKSRARHTNDNALVEGKNGSIVRKHIGYMHIPQRYAHDLNEFYRNHLNLYLNFHRPCGFATLKTDRKGKEKKVYDVYRTPFEALKSHPRASEFLKEGLTLKNWKKSPIKRATTSVPLKCRKPKRNYSKI